MRRINPIYWLRRLAGWCLRRRRKRAAPPPPPHRPGPYRRFFTRDRRVEDIRPRKKRR